MKVYPAPGLKVRDPVTMQHIPNDGHEVSENDMHWAMMINHGDVTTTPPAVAVPSKSAAAETAREAK
ncbi:hypothetical protein R69746_05661 [Paraburkholderia aspalathi]|uniref:DUF2635 domain-containing protein n=1 Tax=Paraburkholderia aspalathi TaxID=1324617 RepID=UPI00190B6C6A|nr:DUF2635 domain-containing protein [Paraburkholderia aspalathi]MBK3841717.1 DUF2635 domain-containing protein [Paraburkholderia aspalathi]CAE6811905.1 hypothetical protein R69746_05661 [Paraburkholderia aspalathi]